VCINPVYYIQTSTESVDFTYDSWNTIISALQRLDSKGTASERNANKSNMFNVVKQNSSNSALEDTLSLLHVRNIASVLTLRGPDAQEAVGNLQRNNVTRDSRSSRHSSSESFNSNTSGYVPAAGRDRLFAGVFQFSSNYAPWTRISSADNCQIRFSKQSANGYMRSACVLTNGQSVLPVLQRPVAGATDMFRANAYIHQYEAYRVERDDFVTAFRTVGQIIENYRHL
jgi:hypothetical protein